MNQNVMSQLPAFPVSDPLAIEENAYAKVFRRVVPFIMICYVVAYLDRINVGFAKLQMEIDLGFSQTVYGLGAGMFFIGYFFFEVPSNLIMYRVGARLWIARIMITWGLLSACFVFVKSPVWFYTLRFLLGAAEAGFYPGVILYLTYWYPDRRRAAIVATFMAAIPIAGIFGNPLSGWIMDSFDQFAGMRGWQWMFLIEAVPAVLGNERLHVMAGLMARPGLFRAARRALYLENISWAAAQAAAQGITILVEPINGRDMPGYFIHRQDEAHAICQEIGAPNLRVQFDFYHAQIVEGDLSIKLREQITRIGHIQVAGVPDRHEPDREN